MAVPTDIPTIVHHQVNLVPRHQAVVVPLLHHLAAVMHRLGPVHIKSLRRVLRTAVVSLEHWPLRPQAAPVSSSMVRLVVLVQRPQSTFPLTISNLPLLSKLISSLGIWELRSLEFMWQWRTEMLQSVLVLPHAHLETVSRILHLQPRWASLCWLSPWLLTCCCSKCDWLTLNKGSWYCVSQFRLLFCTQSVVKKHSALTGNWELLISSISLPLMTGHIRERYHFHELRAIQAAVVRSGCRIHLKLLISSHTIVFEGVDPCTTHNSHPFVGLHCITLPINVIMTCDGSCCPAPDSPVLHLWIIRPETRGLFTI